jgi:hypothetical protein
MESEQNLEFDDIEPMPPIEKRPTYESDTDGSEESTEPESSQSESLHSSPIKKPRS